MFGIDENRASFERLALPLGKRKVAIAADEVIGLAPQLETLPSVLELALAETADGEVQADVDVPGIGAQRGRERLFRLASAAGELEKQPLGAEHMR